MHVAISVFYNVLLFPSSVNYHALCVNSIIKISHALANKTGVSYAII